MSTPAGWYPDPAGDPTLVRYWDGGQWTANTQPMIQEAAPPPPAADPYSAAPPPPGPSAPAEPAAPTGFEPATPTSFEPAGPTGFEPTPDPYAPSSFEPTPDPYAPTPPEFTPAPPEFTPEPPAPQTPTPVAPAAEQFTPAPPGPTPQQPAPAPTGFEPVPTEVAPGPTFNDDGTIAGITTDLLDEKYAEVASGVRVVLQNSKMLKVTLGEPVLARQGSMVAFQGTVDFAYEGSGGVGKMLKKVASGEGVPLMRCSGQGEVFFANNADQIHILHLDGVGLSVNGKNILAFEPTLTWDIERVKGAGVVSGGLFNTRLQGHGWVAITSNGDPVVLKTDQPTYADPDAAIAWSANLTTSLNRTAKSSALVGRGSGEAFQLAFTGQGMVVVQPAEGDVPPHSHAN